jgi:CBS-domain-containing membrane protein
MMRVMSEKGLGCAAVVDAQDRLQGIFTDGDLRRLIERGQDLRSLSAGDVMHRNPRTVKADALAVDAADLMEEARITVVLVLDADKRLAGAIGISGVFLPQRMVVFLQPRRGRLPFMARTDAFDVQGLVEVHPQAFTALHAEAE